MRLGAGFPEGICRRGDDLGLGAVLTKLATLHGATGEDRYEPDPHLQELVAAGRTGRAAGAGFFQYDADAPGVSDHGSGGPGGYAYLNVGVEDGVMAVEIDRTDRHNALSEAVREELVDLFSAPPPDGVRCVTVEGAGEVAFSAGADISEFLGAGPAELVGTEADTSAFDAVADYPLPVVAKVDGLCLGAGFEVALACDLRYATERSTFGFPEITLGLIPGGGGTQRLRRLAGPARTKELVYRGHHVGAERAEEWGLVNRAVPAEEFEETVGEVTSDLREGPPVALRFAKAVVDAGGDASLDAATALELQAFGLLLGTEDAEEGATAFLEDRDPEFVGR
jgi:enoyl-CoA hydratase/3-hydroxyacyl-CoA dehydrogenase